MGVDFYTRLLIRMAMFVRRPPSRSRMIVIAIAVVATLTIAGIERWVGWPEWARVERMPGRLR